MTEQQIRQKVVSTAQAWLGKKESDGGHKPIIDLYNSHKPLARGYAVKYTDEWCATFVSAVAIKVGLTDIMPTECSCSKMVELYKKLGRWAEADNYVPSPGDIMMYDWGDTGVGDNAGNPDHVGIVESVSNLSIRVIEGNKNQAVAYRTMSVNGKYIRGYCIPNYAKKATASTTASVAETATVTLPQLSKGSKGHSVNAMQLLLTAAGYNTKGIDGSFGANTDAALRKYQSEEGLTVDGVCGKQTWTSLLNG